MPCASSALSGATMVGLTMGLTRNATTADWIKANSAPNLWPVEGQVTGSFGERIDPFNGEGAFHSGVDISSGVRQSDRCPGSRRGDIYRFDGRLRQGHRDRSWQRHQHSLRTPLRICSHLRTSRASRRYHRIRWRKRTIHGASPSLRSSHQRYPSESLQVPPHQRRAQRRLRCRKLETRPSVLSSASVEAPCSRFLHITCVTGRVVVRAQSCQPPR